MVGPSCVWTPAPAGWRTGGAPVTWWIGAARRRIGPRGGRRLAGRGWPPTAVARDGTSARWDLPEPGLRASVVVPTRHNRPLLESLVPRSAGTGYPDWELVVIDNGGRTDERQDYYDHLLDGLDARVIWWDEPFNYGTVNNHAVAQTDGDVVVLLNDDTQTVRRTGSPSWSVGPPRRDRHVGVQLVNGDGVIQHGGVVIGMGFANHLFAGLPPHTDTVLRVDRPLPRDTSANTAACVALRPVGVGPDRRPRRALRPAREATSCWASTPWDSACATSPPPRSTFATSESVTRGADVPVHDMYASYWRYHRWLKVSDPTSPRCAQPARPTCACAPATRAVRTRAGRSLAGPAVRVFRQTASEAEALMLADLCRLPDVGLTSSPPNTRAWAVPRRSGRSTGSSPTSRTPSTAGSPPFPHRRAPPGQPRRGEPLRGLVGAQRGWFRSAIRAIFPGLADSPIVFHDGSLGERLNDLPTAMSPSPPSGPPRTAVAAFHGAVRRFYLVQDFEPVFHPCRNPVRPWPRSPTSSASTGSATRVDGPLLPEDYGGVGSHSSRRSTPRCSTPGAVLVRDPDDPIRLFLYARPGHWRNCWSWCRSRSTSSRPPTVVASRSSPPARGPGPRTSVGHRAPRPPRLPGHRRPLPFLRHRDLLTVSPHPVVPAARADGLRCCGGGVRPAAGLLDPRRRRGLPAQPPDGPEPGVQRRERSTTTPCAGGLQAGGLERIAATTPTGTRRCRRILPPAVRSKRRSTNATDDSTPSTTAR